MTDQAPSITVSALFSVQVVNHPIFDRGVVEHGDGKFSIVKFRPDHVENFPDTKLDAESTFTFEEVSNIAKMALSEDPAVREVPHAARKIAAALLIVLTGLGQTNVHPR